MDCNTIRCCNPFVIFVVDNAWIALIIDDRGDPIILIRLSFLNMRDQPIMI